MVRFRDLLKHLHDHNLEFVVIGGVAAVLHGSSLATADVDVCVSFDDENLPKILAALRPIHPRLRHRPDKMPLPDDPEGLRGLKNLYLETDLGRLDLLGELPEICTYPQLADKTELMDVGGFTCRVLTLDALIDVKKRVGRNKDIYAVMHLEALKKRKGN